MRKNSLQIFYCLIISFALECVIMKKVVLAPSLLSADFFDLSSALKKIESSPAGIVHIDVMDGLFVPSISFGFPIITSLREVTDLPFDVHLMIEQPERYIEAFAKACGGRADTVITIHAEATKHLDRALQMIHQAGAKAGVALNPATSLVALDYVMDNVDQILIMTVNPGFGGQSYIDAMTDKIRETKKKIGNRPIDIEVDGGIKLANRDLVTEAGANVLVAGSSVFGGDIAENIRRFKEEI